MLQATTHHHPPAPAYQPPHTPGCRWAEGCAAITECPPCYLSALVGGAERIQRRIELIEAAASFPSPDGSYAEVGDPGFDYGRSSLVVFCVRCKRWSVVSAEHHEGNMANIPEGSLVPGATDFYPARVRTRLEYYNMIADMYPLLQTPAFPLSAPPATALPQPVLGGDAPGSPPTAEGGGVRSLPRAIPALPAPAAFTDAVAEAAAAMLEMVDG
jgi:hypothetical protein